MGKNRRPHGSEIGEGKRVLKVGEISAKNDILTIQYKLRAHIGIRTNRSIERDSQKRYNMQTVEGGQDVNE